MNAIAAGWKPEQVRLWTGSAFAALLAHLAPAVLLIFYIREPPRPQPPPGSPMEVELASLPASPSPVASLTPPTPLPQKPQPELKRPVPEPLARMEPIAPDTAPTPSDAAPANDAGATSAPAALSDSTNLTQQLWVSELVSQLESHKEYPSSAIAALQRDTVNLQISVDRAGHVTSSQIHSSHHYQALEQEVQRMLQLAGPLPTPPQLPAEGLVVTVPVQFSLLFRYCKGSHCQTLSAPLANARKSRLHAMAAPAPKLADCHAPTQLAPAPAGASATLEQMQAYREQLNQYVIAGGSQLECLGQVPGTIALASRKTLSQQLHALVDNFNSQEQLFESQAQAKALQAKETRQRQLLALTMQAFDTCKLPTAPRAPQAALTAASAQTYRRQIIGYQSAIRTYLACVHQTDLAGRAPERGLASAQRFQVELTGLQLGKAATQSFNQVITDYNTQVQRLRKQALAAQTQQNLDKAVAGASDFSAQHLEHAHAAAAGN